MTDSDTPLVSVSCIAYNHERFIAAALDGFLMQRTRFPFEILVHDDASTDGTADIIRRYSAQHPDVIKPVLQTENQFSLGRRPGPQINYPRARGKYIALCEGDDYWTDPDKLQVQIDFLETHPEVFFCGHAVRQIDDAGSVVTHSRFDIHEDRYISQDELAFGRVEIPTLSVMFRNAVRIPPFSVINGDTFTFCFFSNFGAAFISKAVMGVHRAHRGGIWSTMTAEQRFVARLETLGEIPGVIDPPRKSIAYLRLLLTALEDTNVPRKLKTATRAFLMMLAWLRPNSIRFIAARLWRRFGIR